MVTSRACTGRTSIRARHPAAADPGGRLATQDARLELSGRTRHRASDGRGSGGHLTKTAAYPRHTLVRDGLSVPTRGYVTAAGRLLAFLAECGRAV
jgi:hypothetical protein